MTLEEKIARAQHTLRERAEQRKRQYDKGITFRSGKKNNSAKAENSEEIKAKPNIEEIEAQNISEPVAESNLKAPVHHEHELRDALEVEIYHKPSDDSQTKEVIEDLKTTDNKETEEIKDTILDESIATDEQNNENQAPEEKQILTSNDSTMCETDVIGEKNNSSRIGENEIGNPMHIRESSSVEDIPYNVNEIDKKIEQKTPLIVQTQSVETMTPKPPTEKEVGSENNSHDNFDYTQTVINENVNKPAKSYLLQSNQNEFEIVTEVNPQKNEIQNTNVNEVTCSVMEHTDVNQVKDPGTTSTDAVNVNDMKQLEENENMDVVLFEEINNTAAETTSLEQFYEERNVVEITANENVSDDKDKLEINVNEKQHEHLENPSSTKRDSDADIYEPSDVIKVEAEVGNETILESKNLNQYNENENGTVEFPLNESGQSGIKEKERRPEPVLDKKPEDVSDFTHTNNRVDAISEHRVLVVELADVKDDNASVPDRNVENIVNNKELTLNRGNLSDTSFDVTNEDTNTDFLSAFETDLDKPDTDQLSKDIQQTIQERSKRNLENISEGIETTSNTTDVEKSDNETTSLGKFSSMDDSAPDDGNDNVGNEIKTNSSAMDLETAAVTIQKVFRSFLFKSRASTFEDSVNDDNNLTDEDTEKVCIFYDRNGQCVSTIQ